MPTELKIVPLCAGHLPMTGLSVSGFLKTLQSWVLYCLEKWVAFKEICKTLCLVFTVLCSVIWEHLVTWNNLWVIGAIGHTNGKHVIANIRLLIWSPRSCQKQTIDWNGTAWNCF